MVSSSPPDAYDGLKRFCTSWLRSTARGMTAPIVFTTIVAAMQLQHRLPQRIAASLLFCLRACNLTPKGRTVAMRHNVSVCEKVRAGMRAGNGAKERRGCRSPGVSALAHHLTKHNAACTALKHTAAHQQHCRKTSAHSTWNNGVPTVK
uniref:Uncharacterized protein n=1 Tax=Anopheles coluzzii TaxID=1518534 RepID=A0A8W7PKJ4_ANOCL